MENKMKSNNISSKFSFMTQLLAVLFVFSLPLDSFAARGCCSGHKGFDAAKNMCKDGTAAGDKCATAQAATKKPKATKATKASATTPATTTQGTQKPSLLKKLMGGGTTNKAAKPTKAKGTSGNLKGCCSGHKGVDSVSGGQVICKDKTISPGCKP
jgi:hypothetical protein